MLAVALLEETEDPAMTSTPILLCVCAEMVTLESRVGRVSLFLITGNNFPNCHFIIKIDLITEGRAFYQTSGDCLLEITLEFGQASVILCYEGSYFASVIGFVKILNLLPYYYRPHPKYEGW